MPGSALDRQHRFHCGAIWLGILLLFLVTAARAAVAQQGAGPKSDTFNFVTLVPGEGRELDLYPAPGRPLVVFVHGGGWMQGDRSAARFLIRPLLQAGFAFATIEYRKRPQVPLSRMVADVRDAITFLRQRVESGSNEFDAERIGIIGHSAGAHLAAAAALTNPPLPGVRQVTLLDGTGYDLSATIRERPGIGVRLELDEDSAKPMSPTALLDSSKAKLDFFVAAGSDVRGTEAGGRSFAELLNSRGRPAAFRFYPGIRHGEFIRWQTSVVQVDDDVIASLRKCLE